MKDILNESIELQSLDNIQPMICYFVDNKKILKTFISKISNMVEIAYAKSGGYAGDSSPKSLLKNTDRAKLVFDINNELIAIALYRTDLGGFKRFCSAGIPENAISLQAVQTIVQDDIEPYDNWYWVEASGFIETLFKRFGGNPIPNYLANEFLRLSPDKLLLDDDGVHYIRTVGSAKIPKKKMIFGFKDKAIAEKICLNIANYEDFKLNVNKLFESDSDVDIACQIIRQIFEFHDEWNCNEMLPEWFDQIKLAITKIQDKLKHDISSEHKRMLIGVLERAKTCMSEMPKITVKKFKA